MEENYLEQILPFLKNMDSDRRAQFYEYFQNIPLWLAESFAVEKLKKKTIFIREGEPVDAVYFIIDGIIKATDYRIYGIAFDFMLFSKVYAFGGMEVIMGEKVYRTSLQTVTDCIVLKIPKSQFDQWMKSDIRALRHEAKLMGEYLLEQARSVRAFLFLQGEERLSMLLTNRYEKYAVDGILQLKSNRIELSDCTGLSEKTITRSVKKLEEKGLISKKGTYIIVTAEQYTQIKESLSHILEEDV